MIIFGYEIIIRRINEPLHSLNAEHVEALARQYENYEMGGTFRKITRIKAVRNLVPGTSLKDAKAWVESHL